MAVVEGLRMEIEIPLAGHDTETEGSLVSDQKMEIDIPSTDGDIDTARTVTDKTISERWSCEGQASFFTPRSLATSRTSQLLSSTSQKGQTEGLTEGQGKGQPGGEMEGQTEGQVEADWNSVDETSSSRPTGNDEISCDENTKKDENSPTATERDTEDRSFTEDTYRSTRLAAEEAAGRYLEALRANSPDKEDTSEAGTLENTEREEEADAEAETQQDTPKTVPEEEAAAADVTDTDHNEKEGPAATPGRVTADDERSGCPADSGDQGEGTDEKSPLEEDSANKEDTQSAAGDNGDQDKEQSDTSVKTSEQNPGDAGDSADVEEQQQQQDQSGGDTSANNGSARPEKEEQKGVFLTEGAPGPETEAEAEAEGGSDISGARADTPNWDEEEGEGAENDAASLSDLGGISQRLDPLSARSRPRPMTCSSELEGVAPGQRGVVNTPVSYFTTADFNSDVNKNSESRNPSRLGVESSREAAFRRAMTLMTSRCDSKQERVDTARLHVGRQDGGYGPKCPQYFYLEQARPSPMAPLKVWQGYGGNIYFQPMQIHQVGNSKGSNQATGEATHVSRKPPASKVSCKSAGSRLTRTSTSVSRSRALVPTDSGESVVSSTDGVRPVTRSGTHVGLRRGPTSAKSKASSRSVAVISQHLMLYLDKQAVTRPENSAMHEELDVIERQQSTGSLNIQQGGPGKTGRSARSGARSAKFDRICRGSVAHHLRRAKSGGPLGPSMNSRTFLKERQQEQQAAAAASPRGRVGGVGGAGALGDLMVIGDKFCPPTVMSPLLRSQTQFSHSSQRATVNSPDIYANYERLPPLEQMRVSLRHMDSANSGRANTPYSSGAGSGFGGRVNTPYSTGGSMGVVEDLKPFIKYSPDVKVQYNRQLKFC